jgi:hypothetical protein
MSEKKILKVNISDFALPSNNTTRKKRPSKENGEIKVKQPIERKRNDTLKKKSILKMIRQHQEERYKKLFDNNNSRQPIIEPTITSNVDNFNKDFDEAKQFLQTLTEKTDTVNKMKNYTLKQYPNNIQSNSLLLNPSINPITEVTNLNISSQQLLTENTHNIKPNITINQTPAYGCLKNGNLPTFRNFMNQTRKNLPEHTTMPNISNVHKTLNISNIPITIEPQMIGGNKTSNLPQSESITTDIPLSRNDLIEQKVNESLNRVNIMRKTEEKLKDINRKYVPTIKKRKKTYKRTYKVGKSSVFPRVSVLVSNKTIRKQVANKKQLLKQTSMPEIKKFLMKRGFIKVGSTAPNDVLRKMYESATLICGEIQNHNPDNLLYNFMNAGDNL